MKTSILISLFALTSLFSTVAFSQKTPKDTNLWGTHIPGVLDHLATDEKVIALTFDACGGHNGSGYDEELIHFLIDNNLPATLFMSGLWIKKNPENFIEISKNPLFKIENHGTRHRQLSIDGKGEYNWGTTHSLDDIEEEILKNAETIEQLTGEHPMYFRSGTAYYDPVAVQSIEDLNYIPTGFSHAADGGTTYSAETIVELGLKKATPGGIYLFHMNWPKRETFEGIQALIPALQNIGYSFVHIDDFELEQRIIKK